MKVYPNQIRIVRVPDEDQLEIRLEFSGHAKRTPISFEVSFSDVMYLMEAFRQTQAKYKIPIPPNLRPSGKPRLSVVKLDE